MCGLLTFLTATLRAAGPDVARLVFYLPLEDAQRVIDASVDPATVTVEGTLNAVDGQFGKGLEFNGKNTNRIQVAHAAKLSGMSALTVEAWALGRNIASHEGMSIVSKRIANLNADQYNLFIWTGRLVNGRINGNNTNIGLSKTVIADNTWYHIALVFDAQGGANEKIKLYINGVLESSATHPATAVGAGVSPLWVGDLDAARNFPWDGILDEIGIWNTALTEAQINQVMIEGKAKMLNKGAAWNPMPADREEDVLVDADLAWSPGEYAATHNVYFGSSYDQVRAGDPAVLVGAGLAREVDRLDVGRMDFGRTYFWRVDEVNAAPSNAVFEGDVWSFTTEPYSYPIRTVTATASGSSRADTGPVNTVNGSGLNAGDQHSVEVTHMWLSDEASPKWIQYEFDKVYKVDQLWVWNANQIIEAFVGFGARDVTVEYSLDGQTWTALEGVPEFSRGSGTPSYTANTVVDFGGVEAKFVRLTINTNWGGMAKQVSLSEVRFYYVPVQARSPVPADGATDVALTTSLDWRPGREATSHQVFFGTDRVAVAEGTAGASTVSTHSYTPASMTFGTKYFWKVNEVGDTGTYEGEVWSFTAQEFATIEDFESYTDAEGSRIYEYWLDGIADAVYGGSMVGYMEAPFAEKVILHGGKQSMPLAYDNTKAPYFSEAVREFESVQNWTGSGASELCVWTRGYPVPASVAVVESGGKMTLTGAGADIWNNSDEFTYAYKTLTGDGSLVARVTSNGTGANTWAKGGVMIRDTVNGGSMHAMMVITGGGGNGASFQYRGTTNGASSNADIGTVVAPPYWVRIDRSGATFTGFVSSDGKSWSQVGTTVIPMTDPVLIGICVTSHEAGVERTFQFEGISATGNVSGVWKGAVINVARYNDPAPMYLTVTDSAGKSGTATSDTAAVVADWTAWKIPMSSLAGVNFSRVKKIVIGVGVKGATSGGSGVVFIDDIGYGRSAN
ncbi:MAG TPA: discoidin domain-containing protein [Sedimentisphaerales bacterium]|nr:discoidin domain-containing protein [Sedimentisphaerales bacterium]HQG47926.1 discoidin domain-containing protein [Sedimentisphaerales bacterium]